MGVQGSVCHHCQLDELAMAWELRLFCLTATGRSKGPVTAEQAVAQAQLAARQRIGRGGLNESAASGDPLAEGARRRDGVVGATGVVHKPSEAEITLRLLAGRLRALSDLPAAAASERDRLLRSAKVYQEKLEADKKLCWRARALAGTQRAFLYAHDELSMAASRLTLRVPGEEVSPEEERLGIKLYPTQLPIRNAELSADKAVAENDLGRKLGTLRYLRGLKSQRALKDDDGSSHPGATTNTELGPLNGTAGPAEACPVCHEVLGKEVVVLPCGHSLCHACTVRILERSAANRRTYCPSCRQQFHDEEVSFVDTRLSALKVDQASEPTGSLKGAEPEESIMISGSYGSKLEAVLRRLKAITRAQSAARVLVFSTWVDSLDILSHALAANHLPHAYAKHAAKFQSELARFKKGASTDESLTGIEAPRVLLLLIKQGGNGLNLTEAQHVILVEPLLSPALEAQAFGRVHRIGQKATTTLHKFIMQHTVEENVHRLCSARRDSPSAAVQSTVHAGNAQQLTIGDVAGLLNTAAWDEGHDE